MLRSLVIDDVRGKVWLHHPAAKQLYSGLDDDSVYFGAWVGDSSHRCRKAILARSVEDWGLNYLDAVKEMARIEFEIDPNELWDLQEAKEAKEEALAAVRIAADALHVHGYPEALDHRLFGDQRTMLHRLMSIMMGYPVAYRYKKVWQVINSMLTDVTPEAKSWHALYLIAIKVTELSLELKQTRRLDLWRSDVRASLKRGEDTFRRDPSFDRLFALLFPALVPDIDMASLKRIPTPIVSTLNGIDPDTVDPKFFQDLDTHHWKWTISTAARVRELELSASRARIEGWAVDESSIVFHLIREASPCVKLL